MAVIFVILAILLLLAALPVWPHSAGWGYYPAGGFALIVAILIFLAVAGWF